MKALVVFSGGQDSTTCLGWAIKEYKEVECISFLYNQKHEIEIKQAEKICKKLKVKHKIVDISFFSQLVNSALTSDGDVTKQHEDHEDLPASFVPNRNALFFTIAHAYAQTIKAENIIAGTCETDYSGYPDCRRAFIDNLQFTLSKGSSTQIGIVTPLMFINKAQTFKLAKDNDCLDLVLEYSHTCYNGSTKKNEWGFGCDKCPACDLRKKGYNEFLINEEKSVKLAKKKLNI